ncbi:hypothetical protein C3L33_15409, partial [Rhododendron williamsianum]
MAMSTLFSIAVLVAASFLLSVFKAQISSGSSFYDDFTLSGAVEQVSTSSDGAIWSLALTNATGCGFVSNENYMFGWFSMKLKLVGGDSAGVVTAYYMCSDDDTGATRDEVDYEFLGNTTGQPYIVQTNVYKNGTGGREVRHQLWFVVDNIAIRVYKNANYTNNFFPNTQPMYIFSSIWNADSWATDGGLVHTNWSYAPFVSSYTAFTVDACLWVDPYPACVNTTAQNWWDQYGAWHLSEDQLLDYGWVQRNLLVYDYCGDTVRYPILPEECSLDPYS